MLDAQPHRLRPRAAALQRVRSQRAARRRLRASCRCRGVALQCGSSIRTSVCRCAPTREGAHDRAQSGRERLQVHASAASCASRPLGPSSATRSRSRVDRQRHRRRSDRDSTRSSRPFARAATAGELVQQRRRPRPLHRAASRRRRLDGEVSVDSQLGMGSTFTVRLPRLLPSRRRGGGRRRAATSGAEGAPRRCPAPTRGSWPIRGGEPVVRRLTHQASSGLGHRLVHPVTPAALHRSFLMLWHCPAFD